MVLKITTTLIRPSKDIAWELPHPILTEFHHPYHENMRMIQFDMIAKGEMLPYKSISESEDGLTQTMIRYFRDEKAANKYRYLREQIDEALSIEDLTEKYYIDNNIISMKDVDFDASWPPPEYVDYPDSAVHDYPQSERQPPTPPTT